VRRALIATTLLAQGTPMICAGDEIGRTQRGNNNAYCRDDASTWLDWANADRTLLAFVSEVIALRRGEPLLRHDRWFHAPPVAPGECGLAWWTPAGHEMNVGDWHDPASHAFACLVLAPAKEPSGSATGSARIVLAFNPEARPVDFVIPAGPWHVAIDSSGERASGAQLASGKTLAVGAHALVVLRNGSP
jgi:glycogen operon protein